MPSIAGKKIVAIGTFELYGSDGRTPDWNREFARLKPDESAR